MKSLFKKISNKKEAEKVIKDSTLILFILLCLKLFAFLVTGYNKFLIFFIEMLLIALLRKYKSRLSCVLLVLIFTPPIIIQTQNVFASGEGLVIFIEKLIPIFVSIRALQATLKLNNNYAVSQHQITLGYKLYFWISLILFGVLSIDIYFLREAQINDYINLPLSLIGFVGLFGYVYKRAILNVTIWKIIFFTIIVGEIFYIFFLQEAQPTTDINVGVKVVIIVFLFCLSLPYYVALYLYGFKSNNIWNKPQIK